MGLGAGLLVGVLGFLVAAVRTTPNDAHILWLASRHALQPGGESLSVTDQFEAFGLPSDGIDFIQPRPPGAALVYLPLVLFPLDAAPYAFALLGSLACGALVWAAARLGASLLGLVLAALLVARRCNLGRTVAASTALALLATPVVWPSYQLALFPVYAFSSLTPLVAAVQVLGFGLLWNASWVTMVCGTLALVAAFTLKDGRSPLPSAQEEVSMANLMSSLVAIGGPRWWPTKVLAFRSWCGLLWSDG